VTARAVFLAGAAAVAVLLALGACGGENAGEEGAPSTSVSDPASPVRGLLTAVDASPEGELRRVTLLDDDGNEWSFAVDLEPPADVSTAHLQEHAGLREPVLVYFRGSGESRVAYRIDDAP
jgi:hypothetical protein